MKNSDPQRVPLCPLALESIEEVKTYSSDSDYVFRSSCKPENPVSTRALAKALRRHWSEIQIEKAFTPHDLRRTLRTRLAELGVSDIVAERVLGHKLQGIVAVYKQHSYDTEKRQALFLWEQRLKEIVGKAEPQDNVIPSFSVSGLSEPVKKPLHSIVLEQFIEWSSVAFCPVEEALVHRRGNVFGRRHTVASRYGLITIATRHIFA